MSAKRIRFIALLAISLVFLLAWAFPLLAKPISPAATGPTNSLTPRAAKP